MGRNKNKNKKTRNSSRTELWGSAFRENFTVQKSSRTIVSPKTHTNTRTLSEGEAGGSAGSRGDRGSTLKVRKCQCFSSRLLQRSLTLFLVQHHRPEERGVLPRAVRPRLQQGCTLRSAHSFSWKWLWNARLTSLHLDGHPPPPKKRTPPPPPPLERWIVPCTFPPLSLLLSIIIHTRNAAINTTRTPFPGWAGTQINRDHAAFVAFDKFHARKKKKKKKRGVTKKKRKKKKMWGGGAKNNKKRLKSMRAKSAHTAELSSILAVIALPFRALLCSETATKFKQIQLQICQLLKAKSRRLSSSCLQFRVPRSPLCRCWINARSFQRPSDSPVN